MIYLYKCDFNDIMFDNIALETWYHNDIILNDIPLKCDFNDLMLANIVLKMWYYNDIMLNDIPLQMWF